MKGDGVVFLFLPLIIAGFVFAGYLFYSALMDYIEIYESQKTDTGIGYPVKAIYKSTRTWDSVANRQGGRQWQTQ